MKDWVQGKGMPLPEVLIDITTIKDINGIRLDGGGTTIGAATTLTDIIDNKDLGAKLPVLTQAALSVASPLIRNFGTLGGNINQRPRCWFFRGEDSTCYRKGGASCTAVPVANRYHASSGGELGASAPPSTTATARRPLGAPAKTAGPGGERTVPSTITSPDR